VVLNRVPPRARIADELVLQLKRDRMPLARAALGNRIAYAASLMEGKGVVEAEPHSVAAAEIRLLANEVMRKAA
jgi:chromosome partitioning protein